MFNVGGGEVLVILLVALVVLGPDKLPGAMRSVGNMVGELRKLSNGFQSEMRNAMYTDDRPPTIGPIVGQAPGQDVAAGADADAAPSAPEAAAPPPEPTSPVDEPRPAE